MRHSHTRNRSQNGAAPGVGTEEGVYRLDGHFTPLDYHRRLLDDIVRSDAYDRALRALVRPGDVVLDLGAGTGFLGLLAARRGARVLAVESTPVARLARAIAQKNGLAERVTVYEEDFLDMEVLEPVDLVISDFMGRMVVDDGMLDAVARSAAWLKPTGRWCPDHVDVSLAPVQGIPAGARIPTERCGVSFRSCERFALWTCYHVKLEPADLLAAPRSGWELRPPESKPFCASASFSVAAEGLLSGFAGWFSARLGPVQLSCAPGHDTHWGQLLFPVPPVHVHPGDQVAIDIELQGCEPANWFWHAQMESEDGKRQVSASSDQWEAPRNPVGWGPKEAS